MQQVLMDKTDGLADTHSPCAAAFRPVQQDT